MNTFPQVQAAIFTNAGLQFGTNLSVSTEGSNSNLYYSNEAENAFVVEQAIGASQNKLSIFAAQGNSLNTLGVFLNYQVRPYLTISFPCTVTATTGTMVSAGLEVTYTDGIGNIYYFLCDQALDFTSVTSLSETFYYIGSNPTNVYPIPTIPTGALSIIANSVTVTGGTLGAVTNPTAYPPILVSDSVYQQLLETVYQSSSFGLDGAIQLVLQNLDFISSVKVYVGTNPVTPVTIMGVSNSYVLEYGVFLILIQFTSNITPSGMYVPYKYQTTANSIFSRLNFDNKTYHPMSSLDNEVSVSVNSVLGNTFVVDFYTAIQSSVNIAVTAAIPAGSVALNADDLVSFTALVSSYIYSTPIAGTFYFTNIAQIANQFNLILTGMVVNSGSPVFSYSATADESFSLGTLLVTYV